MLSTSHHFTISAKCHLNFRHLLRRRATLILPSFEPLGMESKREVYHHDALRSLSQLFSTQVNLQELPIVSVPHHTWTAPQNRQDFTLSPKHLRKPSNCLQYFRALSNLGLVLSDLLLLNDPNLLQKLFRHFHYREIASNFATTTKYSTNPFLPF